MCTETPKLKFFKIREIEIEFGVFLNEMQIDYHHPKQRFSVFKADEKEKFIGDIRAMYDVFTEEELRESITKLKEKE